MPIVVDYTLCDGVDGCAAVRICDAEALFFDRNSGRVEYDSSRCRNCGTCANYCGMDALLYAPTKQECEEIQALLHGA